MERRRPYRSILRDLSSPVFVAAFASALTGCFGVDLGVQGGSDVLSAQFGGIESATAVSPSTVTVKWSALTDYTSYAIYSSTQDTPLDTIKTGESYTISGLKPNSTYSFAVAGTSKTGNQSGIAKQSQATTWKNFLGPDSATTVDSQSVTLTWSYNAGPLFLIYINAGSPPSLSTGNPPTLATPAYITGSNSGYTVTGLSPNTTYYFAVVAKYQDGTNSWANAQTVSGTVNAQYVSKSIFSTLPELSMASQLTDSVPPIFTVSGAIGTYTTTFKYGTTVLGSLLGNGKITATSALPVGASTVTATIQDSLTGSTAYAALSGFTVTASVANGGLKVVSAATPTSLNPVPTVVSSAVSLGQFPSFIVSGAQPTYVTTLTSDQIVLGQTTTIGKITGNGTIQTLTSTPLPQGKNTIHAVTSAGGQVAYLPDVIIRVKTTESAPITAPVSVTGGIGMQGAGHAMAVGDFNCDGYPDLSFGAPFGTGTTGYSASTPLNHNGGVYVYYGKTGAASTGGLDMSKAPSTLPTGTEPLFVPAPNNSALNGQYFGFSVAAGNLNGDVNPSNSLPCSDLVVGAPGAYFSSGTSAQNGTVSVYYGSPTGLQAGAPSHNSFTCLGAGSNVCSPADFLWSAYGTNPLAGCTGGAANCAPANFIEAGYSVAAGDINGDGFDDVLTAGPWLDSATSGGKSGVLFVWYGTSNGLSPAYQTVYLPTTLIGATNARVQSSFGISVAIGKIKNTDAAADIVVGFNSLTGSAGQSGVSFIPTTAVADPFSSSPIPVDGTGTVTTSTELKPSLCNSSGSVTGFGSLGNCAYGPLSLLLADVNNDGYNDVLFSGPQISTPSNTTGTLFVYYGTNSGIQLPGTQPSTSASCSGGVCPPQLFYRSESGVSSFGVSIGLLGDINGDGYLDIGVGAAGTTNGSKKNSGSSYAYQGSSSGLRPISNLAFNLSKPKDAFFGSAIIGANFGSNTGFDKLKKTGAGNEAFNKIAISAQGDASSGQKAVNHGTISVFDNTSGLSGTLATATATVSPAAEKPLNLNSGKAVIVGDINGDGYADVAMRVSVPSALTAGYGTYLSANMAPIYPIATQQWGFVVYYGGANGLIVPNAAAGIPEPSYNPIHPTDPLLVTNSLLNGGTLFDSPELAYTLAPAGDTNGDGYADVLVSDPNASSGLSVLFYGSANGLIVSPYPQKISYSNRPSLDPMIISIGTKASPVAATGTAVGWGANVTFGDFNGDGYSDLAFESVTAGGGSLITVIYGSRDGLVTSGTIYNSVTDVSPNFPQSDPANNAYTTPTCSTSSGICYPVVINNLAGTYVTAAAKPAGIMNAGDMDGDGTDDLVAIAPQRQVWSTTAGVYDGTVYVLYGSKTDGINPTRYVELAPEPKFAAGATKSRALGRYPINDSVNYSGSFGRAYDINGDGLADIVLDSWNEHLTAGTYSPVGYVIYGVPGPGTSPTATSGAYIQQGVCSSFPCTVPISTVSTPDYKPNHLVDGSNSSCSTSLRSCNPLRFTEPGTVSTAGHAGIFGVGDITGDEFGDVVLSRPGAKAAGVTSLGQIYIYSGSGNGLQVVGTASAKPTCSAGSCTPYVFNISPTLANMPSISTPMYWYAPPWQNAQDIDGDGARDFLIYSDSVNSLDSTTSAITGYKVGGFFIFR